MKKKLTYTILILFTFMTIIARPQSRLDFGLTTIPSYSTINTEGHAIGYKYIMPFNYGISVAYKKNKILITTGISHITQGTKFKVEITTTDLPEGGIGTFDIFLRAKGIFIPLSFDYILKTKKNEFIGGLGIYSGYIYSQQQENTWIPKDYKPDTTIISANPIQRFTDIDLCNNYYCGINMGIGLRHFFNNKLSLQVRPNFLFQLRKELPSDKYAWTNRLMTFSLDIGFYYSIGKEEKND